MGSRATFAGGHHLLQDEHPNFGKCDFVMANPPFNVDEVDAEKVKDDRRLPFGLPGVNKARRSRTATTCGSPTSTAT
jgi:type I restriction-modification system DNA methylase subunit